MTIRSTESKHRLGLLAIAAGCCALVFLAYALPDLLSTTPWLRSQLGPERFPSERAYQHAELRTSDLLQIYGRKATLARDVVFLAIDSPSFEQSELFGNERNHLALQMMTGGFPFPREIYPLILQQLVDAGAKVVMFDILFPGPKESDAPFRAALEHYRASVVLGSNLQRRDPLTGDESGQIFPPTTSLIPGEDNLYDDRVGFVNFTPDGDGIVRLSHYRTTLEEYFGEQGGLDPRELRSLTAQGAAKAGYSSLLPPKHAMLFRYLSDPQARSLYKIFVPSLWEQNFNHGEFFRNKLVFIGPYGNWSKDELPTPFGPMLGPKIQLSALNALLTQDYLHQSSHWTDVLLLICGGAAAVLAGFWIGHPLVRSGALLALAALYIALAFLLFNFHGLVLNLLGPNLALLSSGFIGLVWERILEQAEKTRVRRTLERYVSKDVVKEVLDNPESFLNTEGGMRKSITVLFADIRGFTTLTESADPARLVSQLNEYFTEMVRIVFANRGTLDKFIGDAVMAHWGSIVSRGAEADASRAVSAALQMQTSLPKLNLHWKNFGFPELKIGIGVNHGAAICAHLGSDEKHEVTAIGDAVNLASRLESATKEFRQDILIGEQVAELVKGQFFLRSVELLQVKGKTRPVKVYAVLGDRHDTTEPPWLAAHEAGMQFYHDRKFAEAGEKFAEVSAALPGDWLSTEYEERCREFVEEGPPANWDGSYVMTRK